MAVGCGDRAEVGNDERGGSHATAEPVCWAEAGSKTEKYRQTPKQGYEKT